MNLLQVHLIVNALIHTFLKQLLSIYVMLPGTQRHPRGKDTSGHRSLTFYVILDCPNGPLDTHLGPPATMGHQRKLF